MPSLLSRAYWTAFTVWSARNEGRLPHWPLERTLTIQQRRLQQMIGHAYKNVPFYRGVMDRLRLRPQDIRTTADLAQLPVVTKEELLEAPESFWAQNFPDSRCLRFDSSGTSGRSKPIYHDAESLFLALAHGPRQRAVLRQFTGQLTGYREMHAARATGVHRQIRDVEPGQRGDLLISNLTNRATVLLNYRLGDVVRACASLAPVGEACRRLRVLKGIPTIFCCCPRERKCIRWRYWRGRARSRASGTRGARKSCDTSCSVSSTSRSTSRFARSRCWQRLV